MAINFPTSTDTLNNPAPTDLRNSPSLSGQLSNLNDIAEALEAKVGADGSAVTTSHDYKLSGVAGSDKAASKTGSETLTNKTLTTPVINAGSDATGDLYYRSAGGVFTRLPIGTAGQILDVSVGLLPAWIDNPSASNGSTTVKGVFEEATQSEVEAGTATGGTGARLNITTSNYGAKFQAGFATDAAGSDTYAVTLPVAPTAYFTGMEVAFKAGTINTGAATLNVNGLGAKSILRPNGTALQDGDIRSGQVVKVGYDGTNFLMLSSLGNVGNKIAVTTSDVTSPNSTSTTALYTQSLPGNVLLNSNGVKLTIYFDAFTMTSNGTFTWTFKYGASGVISLTVASNGISSAKGKAEFIIFGNGATNAQKAVAILKANVDGVIAGSPINYQDTQTFTEDSTGALNIVVTTTAANTGTLSGIVTLRSAVLEIIS